MENDHTSLIARARGTVFELTQNVDGNLELGCLKGYSAPV